MIINHIERYIFCKIGILIHKLKVNSKKKLFSKYNITDIFMVFLKFFFKFTVTSHNVDFGIPEIFKVKSERRI